MMSLLLSLGHNASAIVVDNGQVICGYEEERLSKVKSDSRFPILAIEQCISVCPEVIYCDYIEISHWFDFDDDNIMDREDKYFSSRYIASRFKRATVHEVDEAFTHHDAHAQSVWHFSGTDKGLTVVADGFGNSGETMTIYRNGQEIRKYGVGSLGLMYQYVTSALGLKENQDEYKLLGYEANIKDEYIDALRPICEKWHHMLSKVMIEDAPTLCYKEVCNMNRHLVSRMVNDVLQAFDNLEAPDDQERPFVAYVAQSILESLVLERIEKHIGSADTVQLVGGIFYNVKLNNRILNHFADQLELFEVMPLAGDQGAALGMVEDLTIDDLFWGKRPKGFKAITQKKDELTFVMDGSMEFGPRALGNTSCIAPPTLEARAKINALNGRPDIMPMAPMVLPDIARDYCRHIDKVGKCQEFMIVALDWNGPVDEYRGVLHKKPGTTIYTCRPQVVENQWTHSMGVCINTSLNAHGQPILFDELDYRIMTRIHKENDDEGNY